MIFNSLQFAIFLPTLLVLYSMLYRREAARDVLLLCASYLFYMAWEWEYAGLILLSTLVDYTIGIMMGGATKPRVRQALVTLSLIVNLGLLAFFKYHNFAIFNFNNLLEWYSGQAQFQVHELLLPVGISFYTFQTLSYTLDLYRRKIQPERNFIKFAVFVSFFPQLVAGPIVRAKDFLPQINRAIVFNRYTIETGLQLVFIGLFKKIVIADALAFLIVDKVFENPGAYSSLELLLALYAYAFQIYCDFSGYSDIAIGVACMLGFTLPKNFDRPYLAQTPSEFWKRWHISLSSWLRDYLYISLGGNRGSRFFTMRNLFITMLLGGLWHGAAWTFVLWGAYHGFILSVTRGLESESHFNFKMVLKIVLMFHATLLGWLIFRSETIAELAIFVKGLLTFDSAYTFGPAVLLLLTIASLMHFLPTRLLNESLNFDRRLPGLVRAGLYAGALMFMYGASLEQNSFIYFQF